MWCLITNIGLTIFVVSFVSVLASGGSYWRFGPNDDLIVVGVKVNTTVRYTGIMIVIALIRITQCIVNEFGMPILGFNVYNPDKVTITDFTKRELWFFANSMFLVSAINSVFVTMVAISQIDLALWSVCISEITCIFTVGKLLSDKTFVF